jgi:hypothetical protein
MRLSPGKTQFKSSQRQKMEKPAKTKESMTET